MTASMILVLRIVLVVLLYSFLAWSLYTQWRELQIQGNWANLQRIPPIILSIQSANQKTGLLYFQQSEITIGRSPSCQCQLSDDTVSSQHARLSFHHGNWWLEDLNSRNGTYLNDETLQEPAVVFPGDSFRCGDTRMIFTPSGISMEQGEGKSMTKPT